MKIRYWLRNRLRGVTDLPGRVYNIYCRARYGIGPRDSWSLDKYVARVIARGTRDLAMRDQSYPGVGSTEVVRDGVHRAWTREEWNLFLLEVSASMYDYSDIFLDEDIEGHRKVLHKFVDNFEVMWD